MTDKWHGGKGSIYRKVVTEKYESNYDKIFRNKESKVIDNKKKDKKDVKK